MSEWQPIETAPHEKAVLLFCPDLPKGDDYGWSDGIHRPAAMNNKIVVGVLRGRKEVAAWICDIVESETGYYGDVSINPLPISPTHWMPLPEPPVNTRRG